MRPRWDRVLPLAACAAVWVLIVLAILRLRH